MKQFVNNVNEAVANNPSKYLTIDSIIAEENLLKVIVSNSVYGYSFNCIELKIEQFDEYSQLLSSNNLTSFNRVFQESTDTLSFEMAINKETRKFKGTVITAAAKNKYDMSEDSCDKRIIRNTIERIKRQLPTSRQIKAGLDTVN